MRRDEALPKRQGRCTGVRWNERLDVDEAQVRRSPVRLLTRPTSNATRQHAEGVDIPPRVTCTNTSACFSTTLKNMTAELPTRPLWVSQAMTERSCGVAFLPHHW